METTNEQHIPFSQLESWLLNHLPARREQAPAKVFFINSLESLDIASSCPQLYSTLNNLGWNHFEAELAEPNATGKLIPFLQMFAEVFTVEKKVLQENQSRVENQRLKQIGDFLIPETFTNLTHIEPLFRSIGNVPEGKNINGLNSLEIFDLVKTIIDILHFIAQNLFQNKGILLVLKGFQFVDITTLSLLRVLLVSDLSFPMAVFGFYNEKETFNQLSLKKFIDESTGTANFNAITVDRPANRPPPLDSFIPQPSKTVNVVQKQDILEDLLSSPSANETQQIYSQSPFPSLSPSPFKTFSPIATPIKPELIEPKPIKEEIPVPSTFHPMKLRQINIDEDRPQRISEVQARLDQINMMKQKLKKNFQEIQKATTPATPFEKNAANLPELKISSAEGISDIELNKQEIIKQALPELLYQKKILTTSIVDNALFQKVFDETRITTLIIQDNKKPKISKEAEDMAKESKDLLFQLKHIGHNESDKRNPSEE